MVNQGAALRAVGEVRGTHPKDATMSPTLERFRSYLNAQDHVLELGGGDGHVTRILAPFVSHYTYSDADPHLLEAAKAELTDLRHIDFVQIRAGNAGLPTGVDALLAVDYLHRLDDLPRALHRVRGMLRPGGMFLSRTVTVNGAGHMLRLPDLLRRLFGRQPHLSIVSAAALERMVRLAGFEIISCDMLPRGGNTCVIAARAR